MSIIKNNLLKFIEPHFEKHLVKDSYEIKTIKSKDLLTYTRFDLAFKLLYLEMMQKNVQFAYEFYKEHIRAFTLGKFTEPGNNDKKNIEVFFEEFDIIFEDIKKNGFDSSKTLIPLSKNGSIANGAHRVASAILLDKDVECVNIGSGNHIYDYKFFCDRNVHPEMLDVVATKFVEYADNVHIAFLWPISQGSKKEVEQVIPNIVYRKKINLNYNGAHNLISHIYYGEEWLGNVKDDFIGSKRKLIECFKIFGPINVLAFQADSLEEVLKIKDQVRDIFNVGKHSIHITDTKEESIRVARLVFNDNSIHFLNNAKPNKYFSTHEKIDRFKNYIIKNELNFNDVILDSSIILSAYGLREAKDTDFFCTDNSKISKKFIDINTHDEELEYHDEDKKEMIFNPKYHFFFNDLKFISFMQLYKMKKNRGEIKDINDCKMMEALIVNDSFKKHVNVWKQNFYYESLKFRIILRTNSVNALRFVGLFEIARNVYRYFKGKR